MLRGIDIAHWHRLTIDPETGGPRLSSRRLLKLLEHLPEDDSAFKAKAERGGRWPTWKQMLAELANESYRFRASYHSVHSTDEADARFDPTPWEFVDPVVQKRRDERTATEAALHEQTDPELAEAGW